MIQTIDDLFAIFDAYQECLYSNDHQILQGTNHQTEQLAAEKRVIYEESILMTLLGTDYMQFIQQDTGNWAHENLVRQRFQELFEARIRFVFDADEEPLESFAQE